jgi:predicted O-linked N-acetylglucosamine transferase (SPINDLY family)
VAARDRNGFAAERLLRRWQTVMPDVASRIRLLQPLEQSEYLSLLSLCDVLLDPIHFGGVTTTYDAIALHQPVVTLPTPFHRGRYTAGCLRKIGVADTVACDLNDYVRIAVDVATDSDRRQNLRNRLRSASHEAFEDQRAVGEHDRIFEELLAIGR